MAKNNNVVLLGYEDELIAEKHKGQVDFTVNKIGGKADIPSSTNSQLMVLCILCKFPLRQVVQVYAPLENSKYHRTLHLFACIKPTCWNKSESWSCLRVQYKNTESLEPKEDIAIAPKLNSTDWCSEADDWGDEGNNVNLDEENCNVINNSNERMSEDEESSSFEDSVRSGFRNLAIYEKNANNCPQGGAVARLNPEMATAEIEGDADGEVITIETPITPRTNLGALLDDGASDMDNIPYQVPFVAHFMSVYPEEECTSVTPVIENHVKELLNDYQRRDVDFLLLQQDGKRKCDKPGGADGDLGMAAEEYEKSGPLHGDKMFHQFVTRIKSNPEQIIRYHREGSPLFLYPLEEPIKRCKNCQGEQVFEFQLIPTIISKLRLECDQNQSNRLDFGTVLIYTCKNSCWRSGDFSREETVICQKEIF